MDIGLFAHHPCPWKASPLHSCHWENGRATGSQMKMVHHPFGVWDPSPSFIHISRMCIGMWASSVTLNWNRSPTSFLLYLWLLLVSWQLMRIFKQIQIYAWELGFGRWAQTGGLTNPYLDSSTPKFSYILCIRQFFWVLEHCACMSRYVNEYKSISGTSQLLFTPSVSLFFIDIFRF